MNVAADRALAAELVKHARASLPAPFTDTASPLIAALDAASSLLRGEQVPPRMAVVEDADLIGPELRHAPGRRLLRQVERLAHASDTGAGAERRRDLALAVRLIFLAGEGALRSPSGRSVLAEACGSR